MRSYLLQVQRKQESSRVARVIGIWKKRSGIEDVRILSRADCSRPTIYFRFPDHLITPVRLHASCARKFMFVHITTTLKVLTGLESAGGIDGRLVNTDAALSILSCISLSLSRFSISNRLLLFLFFVSHPSLILALRSPRWLCTT
jgi:hypothetical protein